MNRLWATKYRLIGSTIKPQLNLDVFMGFKLRKNLKIETKKSINKKTAESVVISHVVTSFDGC